MKKLNQKHSSCVTKEELCVTKEEERCVRLAGLCHDLGKQSDNFMFIH